MQRSISTPSSKHPQPYFLLHNQQSAETSASSSSNSSFNELLPPENNPIFNRLHPSGSSNTSFRELAPFPVDPNQDCRREVSIESTPSFQVLAVSNDRKRRKRRKWKGRFIGNSFLKTKQECNNNSSSLLNYMMPEGSYSSSTSSSFTSELVLPPPNNICWMQSSSNSFVQFKSLPLEEKYLREFKRRKSWCLKCSTLLLMLAILLVLMAMLFLFANNSMKSHKWRGMPNLAFFGSKKERMENIKVNTTSQYASSPSPFDQLVKQDLNEQIWISQSLMELFDGSNIAENLEWIASSVHVSGTHEQLRLMDQLEEEYQNLGFEVTSYEYDNVMLSYPNYQNPNTIDVWDENTDEWSEISNGLAEKLGPQEAVEQQKDSRALVWWNAYSANGSALGQVVYANYGTREDYDYLDTMNITIKDKIVVIRYGAVFRDPYDFAPDLLKNNKTFPEQIWLPPSGAQRGTLLRTNGDPATPFYPSKPYVHRSATEENLRSQGILPSIPVTSIGYRDAVKIFQNLDGAKVAVNRWRGSMQTEYRYTGTSLFRLNVNTFISRRPIKNFVAVMYGREEPDRWVLLAWLCREQPRPPARELEKGKWRDMELLHNMIFVLSYFWVHEMSRQKVLQREFQRNDGSTLGFKTCALYRKLFSDVCIEYFLRNPIRIGGPNVIIEVDETLVVSKRKYNVGRVPVDLQTGRRQWFFGGVERGDSVNCFIIPIPDQTSLSLCSAISRYIQPGSITMHDGLSSYQAINRMKDSYEHYEVLHKYNFVSPDNPEVYTQTIESTWGKFKQANRSRGGTARQLFLNFLSEYLWKKKFRGPDALFFFWTHVSELFVCMNGEININAVIDSEWDYDVFDE